MIIQCEQCRTKFRLDDSRVKDAGVKVRCAKCKHVFKVRKELPDSLQQQPFAAMLDQTAGFSEQVTPDSAFASAVESASAESPEEAAAPLADVVPDKSEAAFEPPEQELPASAISAPESGYSAESEWQQPLKTDTAPFPSLDSDFAGFESVAAAPVSDKTALPPAEPSDSADKFQFQTKDVQEEIPAPLPDTPDLTPGSGVTEAETAAPKAVEADTFSFGAIDSAPKPATIQPLEQIPDQSAATQAVPVATLEEQTPEVPPVIAPPAPPSAASEELPPLSIASRRKQSPFIKILIAILILVAAALLYFQYGSSLQQLGTRQTAPEQGTITLRSINASFVPNANIGEMLVISGEAVNSFTTPRTAIQIKGVVYGDSNQILISKNVFCGNVLTKEQLATMPLDKIEAAMANQFGGALDNLEVAPGKAVPFMIVISKLPEGAKNFGALPAGSAAVKKPK